MIKKLKIIFFILFIFIAGVYAVFQSGIGKNLVRNIIEENLEKSGYQFSVQRVEGALPDRIELQKVHIEKEDLNITIEKLELKPIIWRLFKGEIAFKNIYAQAISVNQKEPLNFQGKAYLSKTRARLDGILDKKEIQIDFYPNQNNLYLSLKDPLISIRARASLSPDYELLSASAQFSSETLLKKLPYEVEGRILGSLRIKPEEGQYKGELLWQILNLEVENKSVGKLSGDGTFTATKEHLNANLSIEDFAKASIDVNILPDFLLDGKAFVDISNLQSLHIPNIYGKALIEVDLFVEEERQNALLKGDFSNFAYRDITMEKLLARYALNEQVHLEFQKLEFDNLLLEQGEIDLSQNPSNWDFSFKTEGAFTKPFELFCVGSFEPKELVTLSLLYGSYQSMPFVMKSPSTIRLQQESLSISDFTLEFSDASIAIEMQKEKEEGYATLNIENLPLDFFRFQMNDTSSQGLLNLSAKIEQKKGAVFGVLKGDFSQEQPFFANGKIDAKLEKEDLHLVGNIELDANPMLDFDLHLPYELSLYPLKSKLSMQKKAGGSLAFEGNTGKFLNFFPLHAHHLEADAKLNLTFTNNLARPLVKGTILLENGQYENDYTGTCLKEISARFLADKNTLFLQDFHALDCTQKGKITLNGEIELLYKDHYPFIFQTKLTDFQFAQIDLLQAAASGDLRIQGNLLSAIATGDLTVNPCNFTIPSKIAKSLPDLEVTYRNPTRFIPTPRKNSSPYPLFLNIGVEAPVVSIEGRGLTSTWRGTFQLRGTPSALATEGSLNLEKGEFNFSSRSFKLTEGSLEFSGKEYQMPYLNLAGDVETKGILISARLEGPLDNPQITLTSSPPLPLGSIVSYLLFGQDVSEIGGFQALQLANSLASLAGSGPGVMENARRSLGVDRLRIVTDSTDQDTETVALEVGKYVSDGVLVSLTQGTDESSTNISVEIELKGNFVFQIESDQRQEQGRFTLKWNKNY